PAFVLSQDQTLRKILEELILAHLFLLDVVRTYHFFVKQQALTFSYLSWLFSFQGSVNICCVYQGLAVS
ncbi:hypothetical protein, partial [Capillibacterium thermochitinicola]|uniref:hypothetical protein n=1 Tax=Capillibacterium thermochitinicola TaxID=2699427 RepID=UPI001E344337